MLNHRLISALLVTLLVLCPQPAVGQETAEWKQIDEAWWILELGEEQAGWSNEFIYDNGEAYRTVSEQFLSIRRGDDDVTRVRLKLTFDEAHDGTPLRIESIANLSDQPEHTVWTFEPGSEEVQETIRRGGRTTQRTIAAPADIWFMPHAAGEYERARRDAGAETIEYRTIDPSGGFRAVQVKAKRRGEDSYRFNGRDIAVTVWDVETRGEGSDVVQRREAWISADDDDELVFLKESLGAITFTQRRATKENALRSFGPGPELMVSSFVRPSERIAAAHRTTSAAYRIHCDGEDSFSLPQAGAQRVEADTESGGLIVRVDIDDPLDAEPGVATNDALLEATALCDAADPLIIEFAQRTLRGMDDDPPAERAEALRRATWRHVRSKDFAAAFASASETLRDRSGDCSEHAVLLCALLRADEVPARIASGLVYVDSFAGQRNVFGWHMWTQALIDGKWIDLDATTERPFHAAHILTGVSDLSGGAMNDDFSRIAMLLGRLRIEVLETGYEQ